MFDSNLYQALHKGSLSLREGHAASTSKGLTPLRYTVHHEPHSALTVQSHILPPKACQALNDLSASRSATRANFPCYRILLDHLDCHRLHFSSSRYRFCKD